MALQDAKISVLDRGFLFGDAVYEVIPAYAGYLFRLREHLTRFDQSLAGIRITPPLSHQQWERILQRLLIEGSDQLLYLQVTRGVAPQRDHAFPARIKPTVFAMTTPLAPYDFGAGVKVVTLDDIRWEYCHIKATTLLANVLLRQQALDMNCTEALLVRDGHVVEAAASNVFAVIDGVLRTPPKSHRLLPGITRDLIIELAQDGGMAVEEKELSVADLQRASEIWLCSSSREILPVIELNGAQLGEGQAGPLWKRMRELYLSYKQAFIKNHESD